MIGSWRIVDHPGDKRLTCPDRQTAIPAATGLIFKVLPHPDPAIFPGMALAQS
jgi:hypothetical protein